MPGAHSMGGHQEGGVLPALQPTAMAPPIGRAEHAPELPPLPPGFQANAVHGEDARAHAAAAAAAGADAGALFWGYDGRVLSCGVVLTGDVPRALAAIALPVGLVAATDALIAAGPPQIPVEIVWPDRILVNSGLVGGVSLALPEAARLGEAVQADWLALGLALVVADPAAFRAPGRTPDRTTLLEEGFETAPHELVASFARHLLARMAEWEDGAFTEVRTALAERMAGRGLPYGLAARLALPDGLAAAVTAEGGLLLDAASGPREVTLASVLTRLPSWTLPTDILPGGDPIPLPKA